MSKEGGGKGRGDEQWLRIGKGFLRPTPTTGRGVAVTENKANACSLPTTLWSALTQHSLEIPY